MRERMVNSFEIFLDRCILWRYLIFNSKKLRNIISMFFQNNSHFRPPCSYSPSHLRTIHKLQSTEQSGKSPVPKVRQQTEAQQTKSNPRNSERKLKRFNYFINSRALRIHTSHVFPLSLNESLPRARQIYIHTHQHTNLYTRANLHSLPSSKKNLWRECGFPARSRGVRWNCSLSRICSSNTRRKMWAKNSFFFPPLLLARFARR